MSVTGINPAGSTITTVGLQKPEPVRPSERTDGPAFSERIGGAIKELNTAQAEASQAAKAFEAGEVNDLASVMVSQQVSSLGMQLALNVRNKALGAYRDIMNMPV
ncbi:MAG: flagellar hook-basal body complex protein FliE [Marivivens sp.]|jgi:flagellar hook-basal body complex protein FliE|nr:flagellar hook-basal body complex protein FliE [Marivivens sp.]